MSLWIRSLALCGTLWSSIWNGGAQDRARGSVEEQGGSALAPPQGPLPSGGGPAPPETAYAFFRWRLLLHRRSLAPPLSRFPQGFLTLIFRFLSQRRFDFYLRCVSKLLFLFWKITSCLFFTLTYWHLCLCIYRDICVFVQRQRAIWSEYYMDAAVLFVFW